MAKMKKVPGKTVRFCVIGVGSMGQSHCEMLRKIGETELTAVCDNDAGNSRRAGKKFGVPSFSDHRQLAKAGLCDAVLVAAPHPFHPDITIDCANAGLHVLCEKPLSERVSTADKMIESARINGVALGVDFPLRTRPEIIKAIDFVRSGKLGKVHRCTMILPKYRNQAYYNSGGWRGTWSGEGGGVMMNQAPHVMDLFLLLSGMPCRVTGRVNTRLHHIEVEDIAEALLEYPDGGTGYVYCSTNEPGAGEMIEISGDSGKICYRNQKLTLVRFKPAVEKFTRDDGRMWGMPKCTDIPVRVKPGQESGHAAIIRNFARHVLGRERLFAPGDEALRSLELANAVWLSAHRGRPVDLPLNRIAYDRFLAGKRRESTFRKKVSKYIRQTDPAHSRVVKK